MHNYIEMFVAAQHIRSDKFFVRGVAMSINLMRLLRKHNNPFIQNPLWSNDIEKLDLDFLIKSYKDCPALKMYLGLMPGIKTEHIDPDNISQAAYESHGYTLLGFFEISRFNDELKKNYMRNRSKIKISLDDVFDISRLPSKKVARHANALIGRDFIYNKRKNVLVHVDGNKLLVYRIKDGKTFDVETFNLIS
ncbi:hypothetical protein B9J93_05440 [Vibrio sp. V17_P4S1T151]|nr:hypothetical protein B9J93_05440 [Vibrio sp. V17_P4S1T151]OXX64826.1 hypothetical protein B9J89_02840 [Vibrio sp. V15_P4S5T153]